MSLPLPEYDGLDGLAIADLVRRRELSAADVTEAALARMAARNPRLNAVVRPLDAMARAMAAKVDLDAPFAGVPMLIKDLMTTIAGVPTSNGTRVLQSIIPDHDSELVARYRGAGAVWAGRGHPGNAGRGHQAGGPVGRVPKGPGHGQVAGEAAVGRGWW